MILARHLLKGLFNHKYKKLILKLEIIVAIMMLIDVLLYSFINGTKNRFIMITEYLIVFSFLLTFIFVKYVGFD